MSLMLKLSGMALTTVGYMAGQILLAETSKILSYLPCVPGIVLIHLGFARARTAKQQNSPGPVDADTETKQPSGSSDKQEAGGEGPAERPKSD